MTTPEYELLAPNSEHEEYRACLDKGLATYNDERSPWHKNVRASGGKSVDLYLLTKNNTLAAGLYGEIYWEAMEIDRIWVRDELRKTGLGTRLLNQAEHIARQNKCRFMHLSTFSFQAPEFYLAHGFKAVGKMADLPPGSAKLWLRKEIG